MPGNNRDKIHQSEQRHAAFFRWVFRMLCMACLFLAGYMAGIPLFAHVGPAAELLLLVCLAAVITFFNDSYPHLGPVEGLVPAVCMTTTLYITKGITDSFLVQVLVISVAFFVAFRSVKMWAERRYR